MDNREIYRKLRDKLSAAPSGVPQGDRFIKILKILFTVEEAELALIIPFMPASLSDIAKVSRIEKTKVEKLLMNMANKGIVYTFDQKGETMFLLFSFETIYNYPIKYRSSDVDQIRLRSLWKEYFEEGWDRTPGTYILPGRVLPVQENLSMGSEVLAYDIVYKYIDEAKYLSVGDCSCRSIVGGCNSPLETCIGLGYAAKFLVERKLSRPIDKKEARSIVKRAHDAGLVSISNNAKDNIGIICHCCRCCCGQLRVATKFDRYDLRPVGSFIAQADRDRCTACGLCIDVCPMGAIVIDETAFPDPEKCIGCGLCISSCPEESLYLSIRKSPPEVPDNVIDYAMKAVKAQGTEEEFVRELKLKSDYTEK
jgi:electron transport complex protein RnfB